MAIKDQCNNCKLFNGNICSITGSMPTYNQTSCEQYDKKGIILDKGNGRQASSIIPPPTPNNDGNKYPPKKQGMFSHPFSFKGRIRRLEYGISLILINLYGVFIGFILYAAGERERILLLIPAYWFLWAQGAKRCHDRGNPGWYQLIPFYGIWMLFADGDEFENDYGPDPKGRNIYS